MNPRIARIARVGAGSIAATTVDLIAYMTMVSALGLAFAHSAFLSAGFGAVTSFAISKRWAFGDRSVIRFSEITAYAMVAVANALFVASMVHVLAGSMGVHHVIAKLAAAIGAFVLWGYPAQSRVVFRRARLTRLGQLGPARNQGDNNGASINRHPGLQ